MNRAEIEQLTDKEKRAMGMIRWGSGWIFRFMGNPKKNHVKSYVARVGRTYSGEPVEIIHTICNVRVVDKYARKGITLNTCANCLNKIRKNPKTYPILYQQLKALEAQVEG